MQTHVRQYDVTLPYGWVLFLYLTSDMGRNLDKKKKMMSVWIILILWIVPVLPVTTAIVNSVF